MDRIKVTQEDIRNGVARQSASCPTALALQRHFNAYYVEVGTVSMVVMETSTRIVNYETPRPVRDFIAAIDFDGIALPFEF